MKKLFAFCFLAAVTYTANAQFHLDFSLSFNSPSGDFGEVYDLGVGAFIEPKYSVTDNIAVGLQIGANGFAGGDFDGGGGASTQVDAQVVTSYLATGTYYFVDSKVAPYAGIGFGLYSSEAASGNIGGTSTEKNSDFGFAPRAGVYVGRLNLQAAYHTAGDLDFIQFSAGFRFGSR